MSRRFKLVTESEYKMLEKLRAGENEAPSLNESKKQVLTSEFPEEVKAALYQDLMRRIIAKKEEDEKKPVPVRAVQPLSVRHEVGTEAMEAETHSHTSRTRSPDTSIVRDIFKVSSPLFESKNKKLTRLAKHFDEEGYTTADGGLNLDGLLLSSDEKDLLMRGLTDGRAKLDQALLASVTPFFRRESIPDQALAPYGINLFNKTQQRWTRYPGFD
jgi:hypothetical protein